MGEYGSGLTMGRCAEMDKERVAHALAGELMCGEDGNGFAYAPAPKDECDAYVLEVIDHWYFQAKQMADSGRAMERVMKRHGWKMGLREYMEAMAEAEREFNDYLFEHEKAELADEIAGLEGER